MPRQQILHIQQQLFGSTTVIWFGALVTLVYSGFGCISVKNQCFGKQRFPVSVLEDTMQFCGVCEEM